MSALHRLYKLLQPALFLLPAEAAHRLGLTVLRPLGRGSAPPFPASLQQRYLGVDFASPVGLAAGFDKDARCLAAWRRLGFGFVEVGTVTPRPQPGNPRPRLLRLPRERSLQNWMGFNGRGVDYVAARLRKRPAGLPVAANVGKNADTAFEDAGEDYGTCARRLAHSCDFLVINVSSPNTPGLRSLQRAEELGRLLRRVEAAAPETPLLVKLSPDEDAQTLSALASATVDHGGSGVVFCNTTVDYSLVLDRQIEHRGGLSGALLAKQSRELGACLGKALHRRGLLISVGGIETAADAYWRLRHGAGLLELYTALVYQGPDLPRRMAEELAEMLAQDGVSSVAEVVGVDL